MRVAAAMAALCLAGTPGLAAELLPEVSVHLRAARYVPADPGFDWQAWIGAGAGLARFGGITVDFNADVETIIGHELRTFDANQANYHLEPAFRGRLGPGTASLFFHHVSRHYVDRPKTQSVDWNILGARYAWPLRAGEHPIRASASLGHTTRESLVGYRWEAVVRVDAEPARIGERSAFFGRVDLRGVTVEDSGLPRGNFLDVGVEAGMRFSRDARTVDLFAALERRNDVYVEVEGVRETALFGFRISYLR